ncbi:hypothetical protein HPULCUR_005106 [Helicostylum pulchrum]|uniref:Uncharacterized protein n=1 Tax=Helicostylum pulchrum TaxID=562976 RepID=A0ABP9XY50_9FUNG
MSYALTESTGDPVRAQRHIFIIDFCIDILGGVLTLLYIPNMTHESIDTLNVELRQMLLDNGYDVSQLDEIDHQLLSFKLPGKHKPGTDLMSKLALSDAEIMNIVTSTTVGKY